MKKVVVFPVIAICLALFSCKNDNESKKQIRSIQEDLLAAEQGQREAQDKLAEAEDKLSQKERLNQSLQEQLASGKEATTKAISRADEAEGKIQQLEQEFKSAKNQLFRIEEEKKSLQKELETIKDQLGLEKITSRNLDRELLKANQTIEKFRIAGTPEEYELIKVLNKQVASLKARTLTLQGQLTMALRDYEKVLELRREVRDLKAQLQEKSTSEPKEPPKSSNKKELLAFLSFVGTIFLITL